MATFVIADAAGTFLRYVKSNNPVSLNNLKRLPKM